MTLVNGAFAGVSLGDLIEGSMLKKHLENSRSTLKRSAFFVILNTFMNMSQILPRPNRPTLSLPAVAWMSALLALPLLLNAETVTLTPSADTSLFQFSAGNNLGKSWLCAGTINQANGKSRALVRFDLSSIPANATITAAEVAFKVVQAPTGPAASTFNLHRMLVPWVEGGKGTPALRNLGSAAAAGEPTWNLRASPSTPWSAAGAAAPTDYAAAASGSGLMTATGTTLTIASAAGLVADLQSWVAAPESNQGWILVSQAEATRRSARRFGSRETAGKTPTLVVTYSLPAANPPQITESPKSQTVVAGSTTTFTVVATGTAPLTYQWSRNGTPIAGANAESLVLQNVQSAAEGDYTVSVSNATSSITSSPARLALAIGVVLSQPTVVNGSLGFTFLPQALRSYTVEATDSLSAPTVWQTLMSVPATSTPATVTVADPSTRPGRFYRVRTP